MMNILLPSANFFRGLAIIAPFCFCLFFSVASPAQQQGVAGAESSTSTFTTFEVPGAGKGVYQGTYALSINTAGPVTGYYIDSNFAYHGFIRSPYDLPTDMIVMGQDLAQQ
jgi:hypothetical protein